VIRLYRAAYSTNVERVALALAHKGLAVESVTIDYADRSRVEHVSGQGLVPVIEDYGRVVVFLDLYGNKWDLIQRRKT